MTEGEAARGAHSHTHSPWVSPQCFRRGLSRRPPRPPLEAPETEYLCSRVDLKSSERKRAQQPEVWQRSTCAPGAASSGPAPSLVDATAAQGPAGWKEAGARPAGLHSVSQAEPGWTRSDGTAGVGGARGGCSAPLGAQDSPMAGGASQEVRTLRPVLGDCPRCLVLTQDQRGASNKRPPPPVPSLWFWGL